MAGEDDEAEVVEADDDTSGSELIVEEPSLRINSLFQNEWLSTDSTTNAQLQQEKQSKSVKHILETARVALQQLIPNRDEIPTVSGDMSEWLSVMAEIFPMGSLARSRDEILASYDAMHLLTVDPWALATWLMSLTLVFQQLSPQSSPNTFLDTFKKRYSFARHVCDTVESTLLSHDSLLGTTQGLLVAQLYLRVNLAGGNIQKTWLFQRRVIAIAEFIGLPRVAKISDMRKANGKRQNDIDVTRAHIWESLCAIDRVAGVLNGYPIATRWYSFPPQELILPDGSLRPMAYILRLSTIAIGVSELEDHRFSQQPEFELYASVLRLDDELRGVRASMPKDWWDYVNARIGSSDVLRFFHCCISLQIHLPFVLREDRMKQFVYSQTSGLEAGMGVLYRWSVLRRSMPDEFFLVPVVDVQAFTAMVVIVLACHAARMDRTRSIIDPTQRDQMEQTVTSALALMEEKAKHALGSGSARRVAAAVRNLRKLLSGEDNSSAASGFKLTVPMLGTIHVQRQQSKKTGRSSREAHQAMESWDNQYAHMSMQSQTGIQAVSPISFSNSDGSSLQQPLSYFIDYDSEAMFQEQLMFGNPDLFHEWQYDFNQPAQFN